MWQRLGKLVIKYRFPLLIVLFATTAVMGFFASKVKLSYEFSRAIPTDNPKYKDYVAFRQKFGDDGNLLVIGVQSDKIFELATFNKYKELQKKLKGVTDVEDVLSVPSAVNLEKDLLTEKLNAVKIFSDSIATQAALDSAKNVFLNLPFYRSLLYNPDSAAYLMGVRINKDSLNSAKRSKIVKEITAVVNKFETDTKIEAHLSGLPLIRTVVGDRIQKEMRFFLIGSLVLSALILLLFFRSFSTTVLSLSVVILGVVWSLGVIYLFGYKITLLTALIPPLVVVIGIPNCIYFINKFHTSYLASNDKNQSLVDMVSKMGIVTLFCNITAAIGFAVFALTKSAILKEFGAVAGISIMLIFVISFILLPSILSYLPSPKGAQTKYLNNRFAVSFLLRIERWVVNHKKVIYGVTVAALVFAVIGIFKLKTVAFIVDDLPKTDKVYTDLKFFERNFKGVMPLEIVIDTKKRNGLAGMRALTVFEKVDSLSQYISAQKNMNRPLSVAEGLKFAKQAFYDGDSASYLLPNTFDGAFVGEYLRPNKNDTGNKNNFLKMLTAFMDTSRQSTRISVNMADVGTVQLPLLLAGVQNRANQLFDSTQYNVKLTGTSITFLEGSKFIINGLKESIFWAFLLISLCMLYLFKSVRILLCSLIPNLIPLVITAGVMGWAGVPLKPSTVLVFSVALGIAIDITIRFLVNYKQELPVFDNDVEATVMSTIKHTGLSIVYTSLVLIAGFVIFCFSSFGGTFALGWLTSVTLLVATMTNLVLLPTLLLLVKKEKK
ncbi:MMPL family transporter [Ferruginibacter lapsinanis]|uniref:efflux RND transporter permease subunit n=1 Tax=Ferruginibacter lapsinanis TaxID=563172 RepID=UPI001E65D5F7|nr:MMPL family transporter [Ferruginibacter lapsinanis]UEG50960.1 MMPL family transporter [Ferruginibacter lapsinanis]